MKKSTPPGYDYSEDALERASIELLVSLGWQPLYLKNETFGITENRTSDRETILSRRLRDAVEKLNPGLPENAYEQAIEALTRDRSAMITVNAACEFYKLLKDGVDVTFRNDEGGESDETIRVIDWNNPANNDFVIASQMTIRTDLYNRRPDLIGFVNGFPFAFIELKAPHIAVKNSYDDNLRDYKDTIPHIFIPNAFILLSNGSETRIGTLTSEWEHFFEWKRISDENEKGVISLDTALRGLCDHTRLLDYIENFTVFQKVKGGQVRIIAKNHQYLGVNRAINAVHEIKSNNGKLGVFWHTQGSGKSLSMVFFTQKILRKLSGNWTFVVITDRVDLDGQIYKTFADTGAVSEKEAHAKNSTHLRQLLGEDHRYVFTLIQKFRTEAGQEHPALSLRDDIIVITDEAHRSQYDTLALNMRNALPNASFIGFTGTPLIADEEERTREIFGDYVSTYNFIQSKEDGATVPLYYENRIPELQLTNDDLSDDIYDVIDNADLDEAQEKRLEWEFSRQYHVITRDDRLDTIANDIIDHFIGRGYQGKGMMVCIDKATTVKMFNKVQASWKKKLDELKNKRNNGDHSQDTLISYMEQIDMAVIVSQSQNEIADLARMGLDIKPHRERIVKEDLDEKFKDQNSNLRLVFVCAMWITGFDVPNCSTIYLDKPMKNHTLMQTIARANRVAAGKASGLIVDYIGVFRNLQKALSIYAAPIGGGASIGMPIESKQALVDTLKQQITALKLFCDKKGFDITVIQSTPDYFTKVRFIDDAVEALISTEDVKKEFLLKTGRVIILFKAILPDIAANALLADVTVFRIISEKIRSLSPVTDISSVMSQVEDVLDQSIAAQSYVIKAQSSPNTNELVDLSKIDFKELQAKFVSTNHKRTEIEKLKGATAKALRRMVKQNPTRLDYQTKFQQLIDEYNSGSTNIEHFFSELSKFSQNLSEEEKRGIREGLSEEELAIFDILTKPEPELSKKEEEEVKKIARELLNKLKAGKLVLDWRAKQQTKAAVEETIKEIFDSLPKAYKKDLYEKKCNAAYKHIYTSYYGAGQSVYQSSSV